MAIVLNPYGGGTLIGSIGSTTFQRGRFGNLARSRVKPVNPNTMRQQLIRTYMSQASVEWASLDAATMAQWTSYAENTPVQGPKGNQITLTGRQMFLKARMFQLNGGYGPATFAPSVPGIPAIPITEFTYELNGDLKLTTLEGAPGTGIVRFLISRNLGPGRSYWKGPFEVTTEVADDVSLPALLATITPAPAAGDKCFVKYKTWDATNNTVSDAAILPVIAAALP